MHIASTSLTLNLFVANLAQEFKRHGLEFSYIFDSEDPGDFFNGPRLSFRLERGLKFVRSWFLNRRGVRELSNARPDVVHIHTPAAALAMLPFLPSLRDEGIRLVYTARGGFDEGVSAALRLAWFLIDPLRWSYWDAVATVNSHLNRRALRYWPQRPTVHLSHGGATPNISAADDITEGQFILPQKRENEIWLAWCGRFSREKGLKDYLELVGALRNSHDLRVVGFVLGGPPAKNDAAQGSAFTGIHYLGWTSFPHKVFRECDLLISTSSREGYGLAILEAGLEGTPAIAYLTNGTRESVSDAGGTLVMRGRIDEMGRLIAQWATQTSSARQSIRRTVEEKSRRAYQKDLLVDEIIGLYKAVLS